MVIDAKLPQFMKEVVPICVTEFGMSTDARLVYAKACCPMVVTEFGMSTVTRLLQLSKA